MQSEERFITAQKSNISFSSPKYLNQQTTVPKSPVLKDSRAFDFMRNCTQLFDGEKKENDNLKYLTNKSYSYDFVEDLRNQHRIEVQKLLLEISRLHDTLRDQERISNINLQKIKEDGEQAALLRISNLRQSQTNQIELIDDQLRRTKEALNDKNNDYEELKKGSSRKIQKLNEQIDTLQTNLKNVIESKNEELFNLKNSLKKDNQMILRLKQQQFNDIKQLTAKEFNKIEKKIIQKDQEIEEIKRDYNRSENHKQLLESKMNEQRLKLQEKIAQIVKEQKFKQMQIIQNLKQFYTQENHEIEKQMKQQKQIFQNYIDQLISIINMKDSQSQRIMIQRETEKAGNKILLQAMEEENEELKNKIHWLKRKQLEQTELFKVKMAVLHENDVKQVVRLYEAKIQNLTEELEKCEQNKQNSLKELNEQKNKLYTTKKRYDYTVSRLNEEILLLRTGMSDMEKDMKQKIENEKSMMMMTSKSFIKDIESKKNNEKFYEEELHKLRNLLEIQAEEVENSERNVQEKIKMAEQELQRLSNRVLQIKEESQESQKKLKTIIENKEQQIKRLNKLMTTPAELQGINDQNEEIRKLEDTITEKEDLNRILKMRCEDLESMVKQLKADIERMNLENQINSEEAKKHYKTISDKNLKDLKAFYDRRVQELENDAIQLKKINSSQAENITNLIKKYKQAENAMLQLMKQSKKRSDLEQRVINLGMDNNLVKNMNELFHK